MLELLGELDPLPGLPGRDLAAASGRGRRGRGHRRHQEAVTRQLSSSFQQLHHLDYILLLAPARHHDYSLKIGHLVTL